MKYINADEFAKVLWNSLKGYRKVQEICAVKGCILELEEQPAVDAVEVVRCKDCVSFVKRDGYCWCEEHSDGFGSHIVYVDEDDYCSFGWRKDA